MKRKSTVGMVPIGKTLVLEIAQRKFKQARVDHLLSDFDIDQIGQPVVSKRGSQFHIIDGQHRIAALKEFLQEGWPPALYRQPVLLRRHTQTSVAAFSNAPSG